MYLKKIELHGFKSFADKVNIEFQPGITGIVGPNGCGKSNISDAVRWVLGEQSVKSLRGSNMADVIFAGSQDRRAQNLAEVTLIFDNSDRMLNYDYNEVEITRRLYRQGNEAEYLLNRQQCRLKDITDLLLDTGLGRDSLSIFLKEIFLILLIVVLKKDELFLKKLQEFLNIKKEKLRLLEN